MVEVWGDGSMDMGCVDMWDGDGGDVAVRVGLVEV